MSDRRLESPPAGRHTGVGTLSVKCKAGAKPGENRRPAHRNPLYAKNLRHGVGSRGLESRVSHVAAMQPSVVPGQRRVARLFSRLCFQAKNHLLILFCDKELWGGKRKPSFQPERRVPCPTLAWTCEFRANMPTQAWDMAPEIEAKRCAGETTERLAPLAA